VKQAISPLQNKIQRDPISPKWSKPKFSTKIERKTSLHRVGIVREG